MSQRPMSIAGLRRTALLGAVSGTAFLTALGAAGCAHAQGVQAVVPLDVTGDPAGTRLGITIGVNGGTAKEYLFDTGSDQFNIAVGNKKDVATWFPNYSGPTAVGELKVYEYASDGYLYSPSPISTIEFYATPQGKNPVKVKDFGGYSENLPVGASVYHFNDKKKSEQDEEILIGDKTYYLDKAYQQNIEKGVAPEEGRFYGTFGAGDWGASILGRITPSGYVVAANGNSSTPGFCGQACLVIGLTDPIRAQFFSSAPFEIEKDATGKDVTFPISGAPASKQFGAMFSYVVDNNNPVALSTMLDTGYVGNEINSNALLKKLKLSGHISSDNTVNSGFTFEMTGKTAGAQTVSAKTDADINSVDSVSFAPTVTLDGQAIGGISFYLKNAVMYDLAHTAIGYTPFYVTVDNFDGLTVSQAMGPVGVAGVIFGQNGVTIQSTSSAYLTAPNTYTGETTVAQGGWLGIGGPGSIAHSSNVNVDGYLDLFHSSGGQAIRSLSGNGDVILGPTTLELTAASGTFSGRIRNVYPERTKSENFYAPTPRDSPSGYGGVIVAGGTETFSGDNCYAGPTGIGQAGGLILAKTGILENSQVVNAGYFQNDGLTRELTISAGTVAGNGNFAGGLVAASGYVIPGDPGQTTQGHMTVGGLLAMGSDATYVVRAAGGDASRIDVNGVAAINGSSVDAMIGSASQPAVFGQRYTILTASGGVGGQFGALNTNLGTRTSLFPFLNADLGYAPDAVSLDVVRSSIPFAAAAQTPNEFGVAMGLDTMNPWLPAARAASSLSFATAPGAFNGLAGDLHSSLRSDLIQDAYGLGQAAIARLDAAQCEGSAPGQAVSYADGRPAPSDGGCSDERRAAWIVAYDAWSRNGGANGVSGVLGSSGGFVGGVDAPAPGGWRLGGLLGYSHSRFSADSTAASGASDNVSVGAYAGRLWGPIDLKLGGAYTWNMVSTTRTVTFPGFWDRDATHYGGGTAQAFADLGYRIALPGFSAEPFVNLTYVNQGMRSFNEVGFGGAALHGNSGDMNVGFTTLGARFSKAFTLAQFALEADATLGFRHAFGTVTPTTNESFLFGGVGFDVSGVPVPRNVALVNVGVHAQVADSVKVGLSYIGQYGGAYSQNGVKGNVNWSF